MTSEKATINDIARAADVSKATVSYVLNRRQSGFRISEETAIKVLTAAKKLKYHPDQVAVMLSECRKKPLNLLVASPWLYSQFSDFMAQLNYVLREYEHRSRLLVSYASYTPGEINQCLRSSVLRRYDAVLVVGTSARDDIWLEKNSEKLPKVVLMNRQVKGFLSCSGNDSSAVKKLAKYVDFSKYSRFGVVISPRKSYCEQLRCSGFEELCESLGYKAERLELTSSNIWDDLHTQIETDDLPMLLFIPQYKPSALLLTHLCKKRIPVPEQIGIIAYDRHSLLEQFISPSLTTIDPCLNKMAEQTLELIFAVREKRRCHSQVIQAKIKTGETTININKQEVC